MSALRLHNTTGADNTAVGASCPRLQIQLETLYNTAIGCRCNEVIIQLVDRNFVQLVLRCFRLMQQLLNTK